MRSVHERARADACRCGRLHAGSGVAAGAAASRHCDRRAPARRLAPRRGALHGHHVRPAAPGCLQPCHRTGQGMVMRSWPPAADPGVCMHARRPLSQFNPGRHTSRPPPGPTCSAAVRAAAHAPRMRRMRPNYVWGAAGWRPTRWSTPAARRTWPRPASRPTAGSGARCTTSAGCARRPRPTGARPRLGRGVQLQKGWAGCSPE